MSGEFISQAYHNALWYNAVHRKFVIIFRHHSFGVCSSLDSCSRLYSNHWSPWSSSMAILLLWKLNLLLCIECYCYNRQTSSLAFCNTITYPSSNPAPSQHLLTSTVYVHDFILNQSGCGFRVCPLSTSCLQAYLVQWQFSKDPLKMNGCGCKSRL